MSTIFEYIHLFTDVLFIWPWGLIIVLIFGWFLVYMLWWLKRDQNRNRYVDSVKFVFLEVKFDELNEKSPLAMEQIFAALHAIHQNFTWGEEFDGKVVLTFSCEIVSLGGKVSYLFRIPERFRNLLESALFAQYPKAEIHEVEDYLKNLPHHYDPAHAEFEFWGTQWLKKKDNAYPIRTYAQDSSFEHSVQETIIDPLSNVLEVLSNLQPYEMMSYQLVLKPVNDDWKEHTQHLVDELKGVPHSHETSGFEKALYFIPDLIATFLVNIIQGPAAGEHEASHTHEEPPTLMLHKTDVEKMVITAIEHAKSKVTYEVKMRTIYLTPKDKFNSSRKAELVGAFRNFDEVNLNGLKPDVGHTWTDAPYKFSAKLEAPLIRRKILIKKRHMLHNFIGRSNWRGVGKVIMNTEELATIFHFPQVPHARVSQLEKTHTVKAAPPMDLPIGN